MVAVSIHVPQCALDAQRAELPILTRAALAALATPTHSMDIERIFNPLGIMLTPHRMGLTEDNK